MKREINDIANSITEKYMSKRTKKGKLTETEMAVLNSKINMSKYFSIFAKKRRFSIWP